MLVIHRETKERTTKSEPKWHDFKEESKATGYIEHADPREKRKWGWSEQLYGNKIS